MIIGNMLLVVFVLAFVTLFFLILKVKLEPFLALIGVALGTALEVGIPVADIPRVVAGGFGNTLTGVGILIGLGVIFGSFLAASGAVERIAQAVLRIFGVEGSPAGLALTGTAV